MYDLQFEICRMYQGSRQENPFRGDIQKILSHILLFTKNMNNLDKEIEDKLATTTSVLAGRESGKDDL